LLDKNDHGFNAFHALCGSGLIKSAEIQNNAKLIFSLMNEVAKDALTPEELKQFYTTPSNQGYTPLHSSVNRKNYLITEMIMREAKELLSTPEYKNYLDIQNSKGFDVRKTYETTVAVGKRRNKSLEKELYPDEHSRLNREKPQESQVLKLLNKKSNNTHAIKSR
jgi:hypothetical protein